MQIKAYKKLTLIHDSVGSRHTAGFSLIEVLVALLVMSIGLVGMAALHLTSLKGAHSSYYRSIASTVALDLEERLWDYAAVNLISEGACVGGPNDGGGGLDAVRADMLAAWSLDVDNPDAGAGRAGIPNLAITFGERRVDSITRPYDGGGNWIDAWVELPARLTWTDARFDVDAPEMEQFDYVVRLPCVASFTPP